jgi:hypothetical protein
MRKDDPNAGVLLLNLLGVSKHSLWRQFNNRSYVAKADHSELDTPLGQSLAVKHIGVTLPSFAESRISRKFRFRV